MTDKQRIETRLVHTGEPKVDGAVALPIFQSSTFLSEEGLGYHDIRYARLSNTPNHIALHEKLASIEGAEAALVTSSGMAAISTTLLTLLGTGDHLLAQNVLYGGTYDLVTKDFPGYGISLDLVSGSDPDEWKAKLRPETKAFYVESISNPLMGVPRLDDVVAFCREHDLTSIIDNTFATPVNFRPAEHGFDLVMHSATKYLNGHTDVIAGAVIGKRDLVDRVKHKLDHLGGSLDTHACFLLHRGLKTLALRVRHQNASALAIAKFLDGHKAVSRTHYPGLESHAGHAIAARLFEGFGGMFSFEFEGGVEAVDRLFRRLSVPISAPSLGGPETLVTRPAASSHAGLTPAEREKAGISDGLVRVSVGLEATEDLIEDFSQALDGRPNGTSRSQ